MDNEPTFGNFIRAFTNSWFVAMSGPLGVPLTIAGAFFSEGYARFFFSLTAISCAGFSIFSVWSAERKLVRELRRKISEMVDESAYALALEKIDLHQYDYKRPDGSAGRQVRFVFNLKNSITRPIKYQMIRTEVDGIDLPFVKSDVVIAGGAHAYFYTAWKDVPPPNSTGETFGIFLELAYGLPSSQPTRKMTKKANLIHSIGPGRTDFIYSVDLDLPLST